MSGRESRAERPEDAIKALWDRFESTGDSHVLEHLISLLQEAVSASDDADATDRFATLSNLSVALLRRADLTELIEDLDEAITLHREALASAPAHHPGRLAVLSNLGVALLRRVDRTEQIEDLNEAIRLQREALTASTSEVDVDDRMAAMSNLGATLLRRAVHTGNIEDLDEAISLQREALASTPTNHPKRIAALSNLGEALRIRFEQASDSRAILNIEQLSAFASESIQVHEQLALARERVLGENHPSTLASLNNLAALLQDQGELKKARALHERVWSFYRRTRGEDHPRTLTSLNNLAAVLQDQGELETARTFHAHILYARERTLGPDHPSTLASLNNLAAVLQDQGELKKAQALHERALLTRERILGPDHPSTLASLNNLAAVLQDQGELKKAQALHERALVTRERILGPDHPSTLASRSSLAAVLTSQGRGDLAELLYPSGLRLEEIRVTVVGDYSRPRDLVSLNRWLHSDPQLVETVKISVPQPEPESMGAVANSLLVRFPPSHIDSFSSSIIAWLRRQGDKDIRLLLTALSGVTLEVPSRVTRLPEEAVTEFSAALSDALRNR
ncbi:tetratricopeptide repeat protein [Streptomyces sp. KLMMK]|uniref:effector-associated constant component EACC1 n=1 Tax=Streptomyces sp. KLMMK TaxID=3109353 RepID=UPI00300B1A17